MVFFFMKVDTYWENLFHQSEPHQIGVVKASGKLVNQDRLSAIVEGFNELDNEHDIILPLVIGGGPQYDKLPAFQNSSKVNGIRITNEALLDELVPAAKQNLDYVVDAFQENNIEAVAMPFSVFRTVPHGVEINDSGERINTGYVGDVLHVDTAPIIDAIHDGKVPVISHLGQDNTGQVYNINATPAAADLVKSLDAYKLILLGDTAIKDSKGDKISEIRSKVTLNKLIADNVIKDGMKLNALEAYQLLEQMGYGRSVQITTAENLVAELLTDGAGTIIRMPYIIQTYSRPEAFSKHHGIENITNLFNEGFVHRGEQLMENYWKGHSINESHPINKIYVDAGKTSGAVMRDFYGIKIMCKLSTHPDIQGSGLGTQIMERIALDYPEGYMGRTKTEDNNSSIQFYEKFLNSFKGNELHKAGMFTGAEKVKNYWIFGVNIDKDKFDQYKAKFANLAPTITECSRIYK